MNSCELASLSSTWHWPGQAAAEASRDRAGPRVFSVWTHLGGQWAFLMCGSLLLPTPSLLSPPGSSSLRVDSLRFVRCVVAHARAGTTSDRTELVHEKANPAWTLTACGPHAWAGNGWDGGGRGQSLFTKSVHSDRVNWLACACGDGPGRFPACGSLCTDPSVSTTGVDFTINMN